MKVDEIEIGRRIRTLVEFSGVPRGTEGVIYEDYGTGIMVAWDLPDRPLPPGYRVSEFRDVVLNRLLRDGFNKGKELRYLEVVGDDRIDFTLEAEKLMAETAPASKGGLGMPLRQWRKEYGESQCFREQRDFIAGFLKRLVQRAKAESKKGRRRP